MSKVIGHTTYSKLENNLALNKAELAKEWHPSKNGDLAPSDVSLMSGKKVWWKCPNGEDHEWQAVIQSRSKGTGCPFCSGRRADKNNNLEKVNPEILELWHPSKNKDLIPRNFTPVSGRKVWWKCPLGDDHEWDSSIANIVKGNGCPVCSGRKVVKSNCLATLHPSLINEFHPTKNGKLTANDVTPGSNLKIWWKCPKGDDHEWKTSIVDRSSGSACPICANRKIVKSNSLATLRSDLIKEWHPTKNGKKNPQNVHPGSSFNVWWRCRYNHEWKTSLYHRATRGQGCPKCGKGTTLPELRILSELKAIIPCVKHRAKINDYEVDIYIPSLRIGIEYDGVHWHKDKVDRDKKKNEGLKGQLLLLRVREKGLEKICEHDVLLDAKYLKINDIKNIFRFILEHSNIKAEIKKNIEKYLLRKRWLASEKFKQLTIERDQISLEQSVSSLHPELAKQWHPSKNLPFLPKHFSPGSHKKIWWKCLRGDDHIWKAAIYSRANGHGCPVCVGLKVTKTNNLKSKLPNLSEEWHPTRNINIQPNEVSSGSHKKVWWKCVKGHEWESQIRHRASGIGCPYCSNKKVSNDNCLVTTHPDLVKEWNIEKNMDITPNDVTFGSGIKVWWKGGCKHEWQAIISNRARRGDGCPKCRYKKLVKL